MVILGPWRRVSAHTKRVVTLLAIIGLGEARPPHWAKILGCQEDIYANRMGKPTEFEQLTTALSHSRMSSS